MQSKNKICENTDTTQMPLHITTALQQTTMRYRTLTTTKGTIASYLPTSLPTEGKKLELIMLSEMFKICSMILSHDIYLLGRCNPSVMQLYYDTKDHGLKLPTSINKIFQ